MRKQYKKEIRRRKRKLWRKYKIDLEDPKAAAKYVKIVQGVSTHDVSTFKKMNGTYTLPGMETADFLLDSHFPEASPIRSVRHQHVARSSREIEELCEEWITPDLVIGALRKFKAKKSPGPDGLKPVIFPYLSKTVVATITFLYKACIALHYTPIKWRESKVIFIPKPGKPTYDSPKSFRPICLSNYLLKGMERLAVLRMDVKIKSNPIHSRQHGFRSDRSTETAISEVASYIEKHTMTRQFCVGVFLDIRGAFDNIRPQCVYDALKKHGVDKDLADWYLDYLLHRDLFYTLGGITTSRTISRGFPQGGVASAKFWLLAFDGAVEIINSQEIKGTAFVDDCSGLYGGRSMGHVGTAKCSAHAGQIN